jgi:hypothetical protein
MGCHQIPTMKSYSSTLRTCRVPPEHDGPDRPGEVRHYVC